MSWQWDETTLAALERFLEARNLLDGPPGPQHIGDGHSNLTYKIHVRGGVAVLRRPPPPPVPKGANDVLREARVLTALQDDDVPTARIIAVSRAGETLDVPFYIMEHVAGPVITDCLPPAFDPAVDGESLAFGLVDGLAQLHAVDWRAAGLSDFGQPADFNRRHLGRLEGLMRLREDAVPERLAAMAERLKQSAPPESGAAIVHNDYRLGNVIWSDRRPHRLLAILDWELATIGDPLLDLGYFISCYPVAGEVLNPTQQLSSTMLAPGFPSREALIDRYVERTGRDVSNLGWYAAMAAWKLAVLYDYQHRLGRDSYYEDPTQAARFLASAERFAEDI